jgi:hypothetical protein
LDIARSVSLEDARATLIEMARVWLRLANEQESSIPPHGEVSKRWACAPHYILLPLGGVSSDIRNCSPGDMMN